MSLGKGGGKDDHAVKELIPQTKAGLSNSRLCVLLNKSHIVKKYQISLVHRQKLIFYWTLDSFWLGGNLYFR